MPRPSRVGHECKLYYNTGTHASPTWVEVKRAVDVSVGLSKGEADASRRESDWKLTRGGLKDLSVEFGYRWKPGGDTVFDAIWDSFVNNTAVQVYVADGDVGTADTEGIRGFVEVMENGYDQGLEETQLFNVSAKLTDWEEASALVEPDWFVTT